MNKIRGSHRTTPHPVRVLLRLLALMALLSAGVPAQERFRLGVWVEAVTRNGAADRVGLREGDLVQRWERGTARGQIESPFDLIEIEVEQAPLGTVILEGQRDGREQRWNMGFDAWGLRSRPVLTELLQKLYAEGKAREGSGAYREAAQLWLTAKAKSQDPAAPWLTAWFLRRAAESQAMAHQKRQSDETYREAVEQAATFKPAFAVQLLQSWAATCKQQNDWDHAWEHYKQSLAEGQKWNMETLSVAVSLQGLGNVLEHQGNFAVAEDYYKRALTTRETLAPESLPVASSLSDLDSLAYKRGEFIHAEEYARRSLAIREKLAPGSLDVAASFSSLGRVSGTRDNLAKAQEYYARALAIREKLIPGSSELAKSLNSVGIVFARRGDLVKGETYFKQALAIEQKLGPESLDVTTSLNSLCLSLILRGDLVEGEEYCNRALAIEEKLAPRSPDVALSLNNLSEIFVRRGNLAKAEEYLDRAVEIRKELSPGSLYLAESLQNLGKIAFLSGNLSKAEKYYRQSLAITEKSAPGSLDVANAFDDFADLSKAGGDLVQARRYFRQALAIREKLAPQGLDVASTLSNLGSAFYAGGDLAKAEHYYEQALSIIEKLSPGSSSAAEVLAALAKLNRQRQQLNSAADLFARALSAIERQTSRLGGTPNERARFRSEHISYYKDYMDVLLAQNRSQLAFQVLERSRARSFLELLAERDLVFAADLPTEIQQARRENATAYERTQAGIAKLSLQKDAARIEQLQKQLRDLEAERESIGERARQASPHFAALHYPQPLDLAAVRTALDPGTALLSYSVSDDHTVLFVVLPAGQGPGLSVFDLKATAKELRAQVEALRKLIQHEEDGNNRESRQASLTAEERELYDLLLQPAESLLGSSQRVLLIPDGPLQVLPFAALKDRSGHYLVEWKPVHTAISATVYAELKRTRPAKPDKPIELAAFGDPLYPPGVLAAVKNDGVNKLDGDLRAAVQRGFALSRLPFSRVEVQSIGSLFAGHELKYLGDQATEERAKALDKGVRYIHFATHGLLDERFPLNSSLVLTIPSEPAEGQENGFLQAWEIFEQVRLDADLVTLSACSTGLGQELNGEGLIGLTRAFQYAGARSVLASLWSVDDYRTMQLMKRFYSELHAGASKDAALQSAQLQLIHSNSADPYYWAAFSLTGDWR